jgi:hypothetical protein
MDNVGQVLLTPLIREAYKEEVINSLKPLLPEIFINFQQMITLYKNYILKPPSTIPKNIPEDIKELMNLSLRIAQKKYNGRELEFDGLLPQLLEFPLFFEHFILGDKQPYPKPILPENQQLFEYLLQYRSIVSENDISDITKELERIFNSTNGFKSSYRSEKIIKFVKKTKKSEKYLDKLLAFPYFLLYIVSQEKQTREEIERVATLVRENGFPEPSVYLYRDPYKVPKKQEQWRKVRVEPREPFPLESFDGLDPINYQDRLRIRIQKLRADLEHYTASYRLGSRTESFVKYMQRNWVDVLRELEGKQAVEVPTFIDELFAKPFIRGKYDSERKVIEEALYAFWRRSTYRKLLKDRYSIET